MLSLVWLLNLQEAAAVLEVVMETTALAPYPWSHPLHSHSASRCWAAQQVEIAWEKITVTGSQSPGAAPSSSLGGQRWVRRQRRGQRGAIVVAIAAATTTAMEQKPQLMARRPLPRSLSSMLWNGLQMVKKKAAQKKLKKWGRKSQAIMLKTKSNLDFQIKYTWIWILLVFQKWFGLKMCPHSF